MQILGQMAKFQKITIPPTFPTLESRTILLNNGHANPIQTQQFHPIHIFSTFFHRIRLHHKKIIH